MQAITYHAPADFRVERVPDPVLLAPSDALVRVRLAGICGSDLHVWHGRETGLDPGTVMGHEFTGQVVEVGSAVSRFHPGDRVASPFTTSCGACFYCARHLPARCERGQLFGWVERGQGLHGGQAELVRVPLADSTLFQVPNPPGDEAGLLLGDNLATGYHGAVMAGARPGTSLAVVGCGTVGLLAILAARELGAEPLFALDPVPSRQTLAEHLGAEAIPVDDAPLRVMELTGGRGVDAVVEAVGSVEASRLAFELVRPGGTIAAVGVHHESGFPFSPGQAYDKNLTWRIGRCPARAYVEQLMPLAIRREPELRALFTHRLALEDGPAGYRMFAERRDGCVKVALRP